VVIVICEQGTGDEESRDPPAGVVFRRFTSSPARASEEQVMTVRKLLSVVPMFALFAGLFGVASVPTADAAASSITLSTPSSVRAGQSVTLTGRLTFNGRPAAGVPIQAFVRPFGGPSINAGSTRTDHHGNYRITVRVPSNPGRSVQFNIVSGGGQVPTASNGRVVNVR
jgi:hypothetical protein